MKQWIGYGDERIEFELRDDCRLTVLEPNVILPAEDPDAEIARALDEPVGVGLRDLDPAGKRVCIVVDDISRPTPAERILNVLLPKLFELGVRREDVYFVLALGSHRRMTQAEVERKLGASHAADYPVYQSSFADPNELVDLGRSADGSPIIVYRRVMESDIRIGIGNIVPHNTLGWSGGSKILFPGVTSEETVAQFHMRAMRSTDEPIFGNVDNSVRRMVERWTEKIGLHFIINTVLTGDGQIYRVVAGDHIQAHRAGVAFAREVYGVPSPARADLVIVDSHPSDCDFWQGTKGLNPSNLIVRDGGAVILVSPFYEGVGPHAEYPAVIGRDDADDMLRNIMEGGAEALGDMDPLAVAVGALIARMRKRFKIYVCSEGVSDALVASAGMIPCHDIGRAAEEALRGLQSPSVVIIRQGAEVVPVFS